MSFGLSLAGGGIKGAAHIGVIKALEEENIKIDYISGTSSGSIVAALYAMGYSTSEMLETFRKYGKKIRYYDLKNLIKLVLGILIKGEIVIEGLSEGKAIEKLMLQLCKNKQIFDIKDTKIPLLIPSVNVYNGEVYFFSSKLKTSRFLDDIKYIDSVSISNAVRASCSYPGVFSPLDINGVKFVDGGIRENIPWKGLKEIGADKVATVVFEKQTKIKKKINIIDVIESSLDIMGHELSNYELKGVDNIINIKTKDVKLLQAEKIDELYEEGYKQSKKQIKKIALNITSSKYSHNIVNLSEIKLVNP